MNKIFCIIVSILLSTGVANAQLSFTGGGGSGEMVYPGAGIPVSTGSAWTTSIKTGTMTNTYLCKFTTAGGLECAVDPATYQPAGDYPERVGSPDTGDGACFDSSGNLVSCGAPTTINATTGTLMMYVCTGEEPNVVCTVETPAAMIDASAGSTTITLYPGYCPTIHNSGQAAADINNTLPAVGAGKCFVALARTAQGANYWRLTAAAANTICLNRTCGKDYIQIQTPAVGDMFTCFSDGVNWHCYDYDESAAAGDL